MQFLFKRRKKQPNSNTKLVVNSLTSYLEKGYCYVKSKWAQWMTRQTAKLSATNQLIVLGVFIVCTSGYSIYLICTGFSDAGSSRITVIPIVKPVKIFTTNVETIDKNAPISKSEFDKIVRFRAYLDSLSSIPTGKRMLDSIVYQRPGLLGSLAVIENYYQSNFKNHYYGK